MKKFIEKIKSLKFGTIMRTILQILVYANQILIFIGKTPWATHPIYIWVSFAVTILVTLASYWYNNDWSKAAQISGEILDMLEDGKITKEEMQAFIDKRRAEKASKEETKIDKIETKDPE